MHLGLFVCVSVCLSENLTKKNCSDRLDFLHKKYTRGTVLFLDDMVRDRDLDSRTYTGMDN